MTPPTNGGEPLESMEIVAVRQITLAATADCEMELVRFPFSPAQGARALRPTRKA